MKCTRRAKLQLERLFPEGLREMRVKKNYCTDPIQRANTTLPLSRHLLFTWHTSRLRFSVNKGKSAKAQWNRSKRTRFAGNS